MLTVHVSNSQYRVQGPDRYRHFAAYGLLLLLTTWLAIPLAPGAETNRRGKPNLVFILIDDMGWVDGSCFGSKFYQTPNLDRLAASGMRFTQSYAACAVCSPTRAAILTGKAPARLHITDWIGGETPPKNSRFLLPDWKKELPLEETTLAETLKQRGYITASIGKWHLGGPQFYPEYQGFDVNIAGGHIGHPASYFWPYGAAGASHRVPGLAEKGGQPGEYLSDRLTDEALRFMETNQDKPFFLYLAHYAVHSPLMGKSNLVELASERPPANGQGNMVYAAMIHSVDDSVGRILGKIDQLHLTKDTIVIFTSDNGGAVHFGQPAATSNAPLRSGKGNPYEGGLRVPLLVRVPGLTQPGSVCDVPVISPDFFPTLLELTGAKPATWETALDGASFVPLLRGAKEGPHQELFWHYPHYWNGGKVSPYSVVRIGAWKLIRFYETGREELYDLNNDPGEQHDLATFADYAVKRRDLSTRLDAWLKAVGAQMPIPRAQ
jgi:arylsulfatase A